MPSVRGRGGMGRGKSRAKGDWKLPPDFWSESQKKANKAVQDAVKGIKKNLDTTWELFRWYGKKKK